LGPWGASLTNGTSYASRIMHSVGFFDVGYVKTFEIEHYDSSTTALGDPLFGNCGGKGTGVVGGQTVGSMGCAANQRNIVCQSNYALKAINGAGNDLTRLENKRRSGSADLTRLEKSDLSRDFFSCLDFDSDRKDFLEFFGFSLKIFCENGR